MRELHGVLDLHRADVFALKRTLLLFDKFRLPQVITAFAGQIDQTGQRFFSPYTDTEIEFLIERKIILPIDPFLLLSPVLSSLSPPVDPVLKEAIDALTWSALYNPMLSSLKLPSTPPLSEDQKSDSWVRGLATALSYDASIVVAPICRSSLPSSSRGDKSIARQLLAIVVEEMPVPRDDCPWQDILDFKTEMRDKLLGFRRFLQTLATKQQSVAEIRDDIEWTLNEYTKEMDRFKLKRSVSFMETYVIPTVEAFESFKPSSFLKGLVSIKKRKIELLEAESKAAGRECAYVFDARKRFGDK